MVFKLYCIKEKIRIIQKFFSKSTFKHKILTKMIKKIELKETPSTSSLSKTPSTEDGSFREENFLESLASQVDEENIEDIIRNQKKS